MMKTPDAGWIRMRFKRNKVWASVDAAGKMIVQNGKVLIKYQKEQNYEYWVREADIRPIDATAADDPVEARPKTEKTRTLPPLSAESSLPEDPDCIHIYTDGASSGNPGPSGIGVFFRYRGHEKEISRNIGMGTNNIAELEAIRTALKEVKNRDLPVRIYTDSGYAYGLLVNGWKALKNTELVNDIRTLMKGFNNLKFIKVKGHSGIAGNERADRLATSAILQKP
jgi:ribonuclease HI